MRSLGIQLWSYNYDPEPTGIGPVSGVWARAMRDRGHHVSVVAAHPHYPEPNWGVARRPYREIREGIPVLRLPLWVGRETGGQRVRQEASFAASLAAAALFTGRADVMVVVSPSFPALAPAMAAAAARRVPWVLWLQDILPDAAAATGMIPEGRVLAAARALERRAYRSAGAIVVISDAHRGTLVGKGVPPEKVHRIYNPATLPMRLRTPRRYEKGLVTLLTMGNIGHSQGLDRIVRSFEAYADTAGNEVKLVITGHGVAADDVRAEIRSGLVEMPGVVSDGRLRRELDTAALGLVSQRDDITEFNMPSKLMNFMGKGIPVLAAVRPDSEVGRLVAETQAGWVVPSADERAFAEVLLEALADPAELERRGRAGFEFAGRSFTPEAAAERFEEIVREVVDG